MDTSDNEAIDPSSGYVSSSSHEDDDDSNLELTSKDDLTVETISNDRIVQKMKRMMKKNETRSNKVDYKGNNVNTDTRDVLVHLIDEFNDHFTCNNPSSGKFSLDSSGWKRPRITDDLKSNDEGKGEKRYTPLCMKCKVNGKEVKSRNTALRGVFIVLHPPMSKKGKMVENF